MRERIVKTEHNTNDTVFMYVHKEKIYCVRVAIIYLLLMIE